MPFLGPQVVFPRPCAQPRHLPQALRWRPQIWVRILFITDLGRRSTTLPFQNEFSGQCGIGEYVLRDRSLRRGGETRRADLICARTLNRSSQPVNVDILVDPVHDSVEDVRLAESKRDEVALRGASLHEFVVVVGEHDLDVL